MSSCLQRAGRIYRDIVDDYTLWILSATSVPYEYTSRLFKFHQSETATLVVAALLEYLETVSMTLQGILALELEEVYKNTMRYLQIRISYFEN